MNFIYIHLMLNYYTVDTFLWQFLKITAPKTERSHGMFNTIFNLTLSECDVKLWFFLLFEKKKGIHTASNHKRRFDELFAFISKEKNTVSACSEWIVDKSTTDVSSAAALIAPLFPSPNFNQSPHSENVVWLTVLTSEN